MWVTLVRGRALTLSRALAILEMATMSYLASVATSQARSRVLVQFIDDFGIEYRFDRFAFELWSGRASTDSLIRDSEKHRAAQGARGARMVGAASEEHRRWPWVAGSPALERHRHSRASPPGVSRRAR